MNISNNGFSSIEVMREQLQGNSNQLKKQDIAKQSRSFEEILNEKSMVTERGGLKFSRHANERLASRNIDLTREQLMKLESGTQKAKMKGIKESLVMVDDLAFVVSIKNNTVITAMDNQDEQIFTNIDGAVIM